MITAAKDANLGLAFLLEVAVYVSVCGWGFSTGDRLWQRLLRGLGGPAVLIVLWALLGAPSAPYELHGVLRVCFDVLWYGAGVLALAAWRRGAPAAVFALLVVVSGVLARVWDQQS